ncbi:MAG TPA: M20/M25/M40 family metallo-hydrolase [Gemmatimonadaceae bacterium]|nr:M20/M25/M40 family metallo-hydrolase [Gemmatimonadaceae bacterium]
MSRGLLALLALGVACSSGSPPGDGTASPPGGGARGAQSIDSAQLVADVAALAADSMLGRLAGSPGAAMARRYIVGRLERAGLRPPVGASTYEQQFSLQGGAGQGVNLVAQITGRVHPERYIVLSAHYDHEGVKDGQIYNGADDNASGVAAVLAIAGRLAERQPESSILLAFFDAEESGEQGAKSFVASPPVPLSRIVLNVNLDMVSRNARGELYVAGTSHYPFLRPYLDSVAARAPVTLRFGHDTPAARESDDWTTASDHSAFHAAGVPFAYFGVEDHPDYHRPTDDVERIDPGFFVRSVETIADALATFDRHLPAISAASGRQP